MTTPQVPRSALVQQLLLNSARPRPVPRSAIEGAGQGVNSILSAVIAKKLQGKAEKANAASQSEFLDLFLGTEGSGGVLGDNPQMAAIVQQLSGTEQGREFGASIFAQQAFNPEPAPVTTQERILSFAEKTAPQGEGGQGMTEDEAKRQTVIESTSSDGSREFRVRGSGVNVTTNVGDGNVGQKELDKLFAKRVDDFRTSGQFLAEKDLDQLQNTLDRLASGEDITGVIGLLPDSVGAFFNPSGVIAKENVAEVVQRNLKAILGAQFTEKEGEKLIARAFNPLLKPEQNSIRVGRLLRQIGGMRDTMEARAEFFEANGTIRGFTGPAAPTLGDIQGFDFGGEPEVLSRELGRFGEMTPDQLLEIDLNTLSDDEIDQFIAANKARNK